MIETPVTPSLRKQPSVTQPTSQKPEAAAAAVLFLLMSVVNYLVTNASTGLIAFTNSEIADTHPVYILPAGYAFSVWGIIYLLEALFAVYQAVPSTYGGGLADEAVASVRALAMALFVANGVWLFLFGWQIFWVALLVIVAYDVLLFKLLATLDVNYFSRSVPWKTKVFVAAGFSANASWVTVASFLQTQVNLLQRAGCRAPTSPSVRSPSPSPSPRSSSTAPPTSCTRWWRRGRSPASPPTRRPAPTGAATRGSARRAPKVSPCASRRTRRPSAADRTAGRRSATAGRPRTRRSAQWTRAPRSSPPRTSARSVAVAFVAGVVRALIARSRETAEAAKQAALAPLAAE